MTTIAYSSRSRTMAADSQVTSDNIADVQIKKIRKVKGYLVGACGDADIGVWFIDNFQPEIITKKIKLPLPPSIKSPEFEALVVTPQGHVYIFSENLLPMRVKTFGYIAIGSGQGIATGALYAGATPEVAVKAAVKHDTGTGGAVQTIHLDKPKSKSIKGRRSKHHLTL